MASQYKLELTLKKEDLEKIYAAGKRVVLVKENEEKVSYQEVKLKVK